MIESNDPETAVDESMQKIRQEVESQGSIPPSVAAQIHSSCAEISLKRIEAFLESAQSRSNPRISLPERFNRVPFILDKAQKIILKVFNLLFRDQREVNVNLIHAFRESIMLNRQLIAEVDALKGQLTTLKADFTAVNAVNMEVVHKLVNEVNQCLGETNERYLRNDSYLKSDLMQQKRLITLFLEEAQRRLPEPFNQEQLQIFSDEQSHSLDGFYAVFEDEFRGSYDLIKQRLQMYLSILTEAQVGTETSPVLDIGCGRGEWLSLLRERGLNARGLDINHVFLERCLAQGLEVIQEDVVKHLKGLPDNCLGSVTGFHIVEHLSLTDLLKVVAETLRVLNPGGVMIFETPNPHNFFVSTHNFYLDPTHRNPLPIPLMKFLVEYQGFEHVDVLESNPHPEQVHIIEKYRPIGEELAAILGKHFYGFGDYAIVGYKPNYGSGSS